jgi:hypothetical protein
VRAKVYARACARFASVSESYGRSGDRGRLVVGVCWLPIERKRRRGRTGHVVGSLFVIFVADGFVACAGAAPEEVGGNGAVQRGRPVRFRWRCGLGRFLRPRLAVVILVSVAMPVRLALLARSESNRLVLVGLLFWVHRVRRVRRCGVVEATKS